MSDLTSVEREGEREMVCTDAVMPVDSEVLQGAYMRVE